MANINDLFDSMLTKVCPNGRDPASRKRLGKCIFCLAEREGEGGESAYVLREMMQMNPMVYDEQIFDDVTICSCRQLPMWYFAYVDAYELYSNETHSLWGVRNSHDKIKKLKGWSSRRSNRAETRRLMRSELVQMQSQPPEINPISFVLSELVEKQSIFDIGLDLNDDSKAFLAGLTERLGSFLNTQKMTHSIEGDATIGLLIDLTAIGALAWTLFEKNYALAALVALFVAYRFPSFADRITNLVSPTDQVEMQSGFSWASSTTFLGAMFFWKIADVYHYCTDWGELFRWVSSNVQNTFGSNSVRAMDTFLTFLQSIIDKVYSFVTGGGECPFSFISKSSIRVRVIIKELNELEISRNTNEIALDELIDAVELRIDELSKLISDLDKLSSIHGIASQVLTKYQTMLVSIKSLARSSKGARTEPVCYVFVGAPGCGKTMFNEALSNHFILELSSDYMRRHYERHPELISRGVFSLDQTDQYYSGYRNQPVVLIDEMDPQPASAGMVATPHRIIRLVNSVACPLNMADLGAKGTTFFNSKVILGTTNCHNWANLPGVSDHNAFFRRVTFVSFEPNLPAIVEHFGSGGKALTDVSYVDYRELVNQHMRSCAQSFQDGVTTFRQYMDECYKFITLRRIKLDSTCSSIVNGMGTPLKATELMDTIVFASKSKEGEAKFRKSLAACMVRGSAGHAVGEMPGVYPQGAAGSTLRKVGAAAHQRYVDPIPEATKTNIALGASKSVREDEQKLKRELLKDVVKCGCITCNLYLDSDGPSQFLLGLRRHYKSRINQVSFHHCLSDAEYFGIGKSLTKPCEQTFSDDEEFFMAMANFYYAQQEKMRQALFDKVHRQASAGTGAIHVVIDMAVVYGYFIIARMVYRSLGRGQRSQGDYPMKQVSAARRKEQTRTVEARAVVPQGGPDDRMHSIVQNNLYRGKLTSKKGINPSYFHVFMVQNRIAFTTNHNVGTMEKYFEADNDAYVEFIGCFQMKHDEITQKYQKIPLRNFVELIDGVGHWKAPLVEVGPRFKNFRDESIICHPDAVLLELPLSGRNQVRAYLPDGFYDSRSNGYARDCTIFHIGDGNVLNCISGQIEKQYRPEAVASSIHAADKKLKIKDILPEDTHYYGTRLYNYNMRTTNGFCGAPVFSMCNGSWMIAGTHVAGAPDDDGGYAVHVSSQDIATGIEQLIELSGPKTTLTIDDDLSEQQCSFVTGAGGFSRFGHTSLASVIKPRLPTKTSLLPSPLHDEVEGPDRLPAMLGPERIDGKWIDPIKVAQDGYGEVSISPVTSYVSAIVSNTWADLSKFRPEENELTIPPTWEEVVRPLDTLPHVKTMSRATSPGYPYVLETKLKGKQDFFGDGEDFDFTSLGWQKLKVELEETESMLRSRRRPGNFVCMSFLKDELRAREKRDAGKTRLISASNVLYTILLRKYTMGFINWTIKNNIKNGVAIGVNPYSSDWQRIGEHHGYLTTRHKTKRTLAGDYSGFDKKLHYVWTHAFADLLDKFYDDVGSDTCVIRRLLIEEIAFSRHVVGDELIQWVGSNTSGNAITTVLNSFVNIFMMKYAICHLSIKHQGLPTNEATFEIALDDCFRPRDNKFVATTFGDDVIVSVVDISGRVFDWFTPVAVSQFFLDDLGVSFTDEEKLGQRAVLRHLTDVTFLKRGFKYNGIMDPEKLLAPLELDTIVNSIRWMRKGKGDSDKLADWSKNVEHMVEELALHTQDTYDSVGMMVIRACRDLPSKFVGLPRSLPTRLALQLRVESYELEY